MSLEREGKTYRHRQSSALVLVVKSVRMSAGTARHTVVVLDETNVISRRAGEQVDIDEVPVQKWDSIWEEV